MKFNSQICTTKEQSAFLTALGLKKETADMYMSNGVICAKAYSEVMEFMRGVPIREVIIPAWSLHRLIEMMPKNIAIDGDTAYPLQIQKRSDGKWCVGYQGWYDCVGDLYDSIIWIYQLLISEGYLDEFYNKG